MLPLRNDLAYLLFPNSEESLFMGNKNDKWEKKADGVYRELLKMKII